MKKIIGICADIAKINESEKYCVTKKYSEAIKLAGGTPILLAPKKEFIEDYLTLVDGILLIGGYNINPSLYGEKKMFNHKLANPERIDFELKIVRAAFIKKIPILGICLGCQMINVAFGGSLYQDIRKQIKGCLGHETKNKSAHKVFVYEKSLLGKILKKKSFFVNSTHMQAVKKLGKGLEGVAFSKDGVCEAIAHSKAKFIWGLQWHPEKIIDLPESKKIFKAFIE